MCMSFTVLSQGGFPSITKSSWPTGESFTGRPAFVPKTFAFEAFRPKLILLFSKTHLYSKQSKTFVGS